MDRVHGGAESAAFCKQVDFAPSGVAFDAAFSDGKGSSSGKDDG